MADGRVVIDTELDSSQAEKDVSSLGSKLSKAGGTLAKGIGTALKGTAVAIGTTATAITAPEGPLPSIFTVMVLSFPLSALPIIEVAVKSLPKAAVTTADVL